MSSAIANPSIPPNAPLSYGDSVVLWDTASGVFVGPPGSLSACFDNVLVPQPPSPASAYVFIVSDNTGKIFTPGQNSNFVNYSSTVSLIAKGTAVTWNNPAGAWGTNITMTPLTPGSLSTSNQFILNPVYGNRGPIMVSSSSTFPAKSFKDCQGVCNLFTLSSVLDNPGGSPQYPAGLVTSGNPSCGNAFVWGKPSKTVKTSQFQFFLVNPSTICGSNNDCPSGTVCWANKCYPPASLSNTLMNQVCSYDPAAPNNNMNTLSCVNWCSSIPVGDTLGYRSACDTAMLGYCPAAFPDYQNNNPIIPGPCTCTLDQLLQTQYPECFNAACAAPNSGNYYLSSQQQTLNQKGCGSACSVVFNCQNAGTCKVTDDTFCQVCSNIPDIAASCQGNGGTSTPKWLQNIIDWIKKNPLIPVGIAAGLFLLISVVFILTRNKSKQR